MGKDGEVKVPHERQEHRMMKVINSRTCCNYLKGYARVYGVFLLIVRYSRAQRMLVLLSLRG